MKWDPRPIMEVLDKYVYSLVKIDEYNNRNSLAKVQVVPFYTKDDPNHSVSSIVVRLEDVEGISEFYPADVCEEIFASLDEAILEILQEEERLVEVYTYKNVYLAIFLDSAELDYLIKIATNINTSVKLLNYELTHNFRSARLLKAAIGMANDPGVELLTRYSRDFSINYHGKNSDATWEAERIAGEVIMFNNYPIGLNAWVYHQLSQDMQFFVKKYSQQYFDPRIAHQRLYTNLIDPDIQKHFERGTLSLG